MASTAVRRRCYYDQISGSRKMDFQPCLKLTIPLWEKEFCSKIGLFSWEKFLEAKKYVHLYKRVLVWDDSAAEEAFRNAKKRFKSEFLGLPSRLPLPSPDDCINAIDWDSNIDPELLLDLEVFPNEDLLREEEEKVGTATTAVDMPIGAIKPTGWEIDMKENLNPLMGMVVGTDHLH